VVAATDPKIQAAIGKINGRPSPAQVAAWVNAGKAGSTPASAPSTGGPPAAETPAAVPAIPWHDSAYNNAISNIGTNTANLLGNLKGQAIGLEQDYGINGPGFDPTSYDPANPTGGFSIDPNVDVSNPFSRAALLKKAFDTAHRGDGNRMAASGQLYSGAYQNAQNADTFNYNAGTDSLLKDFGSRFGGLYGQWLNNNVAASGQTSQADQDAFNRYQAGVSNGTIVPSSPYGTTDNRPTPGFHPDPNYQSNPNGLVPVQTGKSTAQPTTGAAKFAKTVRPKVPGALKGVK
jgi:hypothetical protein